jgi:hypothetical protein
MRGCDCPSPRLAPGRSGEWAWSAEEGRCRLSSLGSVTEVAPRPGVTGLMRDKP